MLFHASTDFPFFPGVICARERVLPFALCPLSSVLCLPSSALPHQKSARQHVPQLRWHA